MPWAMQHYTERWEKYLNENKPEILKDYKFLIIDPQNQASGDGFKFLVRNEDGYSYFEGIFQQYPACCAFEQLNHFNYAGMAKEKVHAILNYMIRSMRLIYRRQFAKQLVLNTVQHKNYDDLNEYHLTGIVDPKMDLKGEHRYPYIISWAKKFTHVDTPIVNHNTNRIIHHIITFPEQL